MIMQKAGNHNAQYQGLPLMRQQKEPNKAKDVICRWGFLPAGQFEHYQEEHWAPDNARSPRSV